MVFTAIKGIRAIEYLSNNSLLAAASINRFAPF
jgi:hypothetical protein